MSLAVGTRLGPYEILDAIGAGGMGEVYRARDTRLERSVAIKVLPSHLSANPDLKQRLEREAKAISSLQHAHICTLHDVGSENGIEFLVMEYLEGETLATRLAKGALPLEQIVKIGGEIADALDKAHRAGIIHRDLKPGNVMLTKSGAKLLDFGLAKPAALSAAASSGAAPLLSAAVTMDSPSPQTPLTTRGSIVGTIQYMSPEQIEGKEADVRSDIFAFGAMLYEMATGKRAFQGKSQISVASAILEKDPEPISAVQPLTPPALERVVMTCLAKDPEERFQSAGDLKLELRWVASVAAAAPATSTVAATGAPRRRLYALIAAGWILAIAAAATLVIRAEFQPAGRGFAADINVPPDAGEFTGGYNGAPAIAPDASKLAITISDNKGRSLWVRDIATGETKKLDGAEDAEFVFWSPDSQNIAFFSQGKLRRIPASGGPVQALCDAPSGRGGAWNKDGVIIFAPNIRGPLMRVSDGGGTPEKLTDAAAGESHKLPVFLPDNEHFLFVVRNLGGGESVGSVYRGSLKGGAPERVLADASNVQVSRGYLLYYREGNLVAHKFDVRTGKVSGNPVAIAEKLNYWNARDTAYFTASADGLLVYQLANPVASEMKWVDRSGKELGPAGEPGTYEPDSMRLSQDGAKIGVAQVDAASLRADVWVVDGARGTKTRATFVNSPRITFAFSPDNQQIAVATIFTGTHAQIALQPISGSGSPAKVMESDLWTTLSDWSRDGRYLFGIMQSPKTAGDVFYVDLKDANKVTMFVQTPGEQTQPRLSPDGKWLAYTSNESGKVEVYVTPFPAGGNKWQMSNGGGTQPSWSHDGRELYFLNDNTLQVIAVHAGNNFEFDAAHPVFPETKGLVSFQPTASPNRFLLMKNAGRTRPSTLHIVANWPEALRK